MRQLTSICLAVLTVGALWMGATGTAMAQDQGGVINLDETVIEGRIQKPEAFYILQHANLSYEEIEPKKSFIDELLKSVDRDPF
jgi:hypothetical protein